jgi:hypothetical protein
MPRLPRTLTREAIQAATAVFEQRAREAAATDEGLSFDDIVIACPISHRQLDRVPDAWLYGVRVMLRADGALVITKLQTQQHQRVCGELLCQLGNYAKACSDRMAARFKRRQALPDGSVVTTDVQIARRATTEKPLDEPLALFEVEVHHRPMPDIVATAAYYFHQHPSVVQVVFLKYFPPLAPALEANQLRVPAMLISFRRATGENAGLVEVAQMCSFGNESIPDHVARTLAAPSGLHVPFAVTEQQAKAEWLPDDLTLTNLLDELVQLEDEPDHAVVPVGMPHGLPAIRVDLVYEFVAAMRGWYQDRIAPARTASHLVGCRRKFDGPEPAAAKKAKNDGRAGGFLEAQ